jgi:hypothetical protein
MISDGGPLWKRPLLRTVQYSEHLHLLFADFINRDEGKRGEHELTRVLDAAGTPAVRTRLKRVDALEYIQGNPSGGFRSILGNGIRRFARDRPRRRSSTGRVSDAMALLDSSNELVAVKQPSCSGRSAALFHFAPKPSVVLDRSRQQVQSELLGRPSGSFGQAAQLGLEFRRDM